MPTTISPASNIVKPIFPDPIPDIIPFGSLCLFAGASGAGKTIFLSEWVKRWHDGRTICEKPTNRPTDFYYLAADRDWSTYHKAFTRAGYPDINRYVLAEDTSMDPREWRAANGSLNLFKRCLDRLDPAPGGLVIVDPIAPLFIEGDQNRSRDVAVTMHWLRRCIRDRQITMICCANVAKAKLGEEHKRPQDRISGSGSFIAFTDTQIHLVDGDKPSDPRTLGWTPRCAPAEEWQFQFDTETRLFVPYTGEPIKPAVELPDRPAQVLSLIPAEDTGIDRGDLEELATVQYKISRATVSRALTVLKQHRLIVWDGWGHITRRKPS